MIELKFHDVLAESGSVPSPYSVFFLSVPKTEMVNILQILKNHFTVNAEAGNLKSIQTSATVDMAGINLNQKFELFMRRLNDEYFPGARLFSNSENEEHDAAYANWAKISNERNFIKKNAFIINTDEIRSQFPNTQTGPKEAVAFLESELETFLKTHKLACLHVRGNTSASAEYFSPLVVCEFFERNLPFVKAYDITMADYFITAFRYVASQIYNGFKGDKLLPLLKLYQEEYANDIFFVSTADRETEFSNELLPARFKEVTSDDVIFETAGEIKSTIALPICRLSAYRFPFVPASIFHEPIRDKYEMLKFAAREAFVDCYGEVEVAAANISLTKITSVINPDPLEPNFSAESILSGSARQNESVTTINMVEHLKSHLEQYDRQVLRIVPAGDKVRSISNIITGAVGAPGEED